MNAPIPNQELCDLGRQYARAQGRAFWLVECRRTGAIRLVREPSQHATSETILAVFPPSDHEHDPTG